MNDLWDISCLLWTISNCCYYAQLEMLDLDNLKDILCASSYLDAAISAIFWDKPAHSLSSTAEETPYMMRYLPMPIYFLRLTNLNTGLNGFTPTGIFSWNKTKCWRPSHFIPLRSICPCELPDCLNAISPLPRILATASRCIAQQDKYIALLLLHTLGVKMNTFPHLQSVKPYYNWGKLSSGD